MRKACFLTAYFVSVPTVVLAPAVLAPSPGRDVTASAVAFRLQPQRRAVPSRSSGVFVTACFTANPDGTPHRCTVSASLREEAVGPGRSGPSSGAGWVPE